MTTVTVRSVNSIDEESNPEALKNIQTPLDGGKAAYMVLFGCLLIQSAIAGVPLAFGVIEDHYSTTYSNFEIGSWIGVLSEGLPYLGAPLMTICCQRFSTPRQVYILVGVLLCALSHLASAFIPSLTGLIMTQGCMFGFGAMLTEIPSLVILDTHFVKRRGLAYGLVFGGADLASIGYSFLATYLLQRHTYRITMIVFASVILLTTAPAVFLLKERKIILSESNPSETLEYTNETFVPKPLARAKPLVPPTTIQRGFSLRRNSEVKGPDAKKYYQHPVFYLLNLSNLLFALSVSLPWIYLPTFATELGNSKTTGALILSLGMIFNFVGELIFGSLSDKVDVSLLVIVTMTVTGMSTFVMWGVFGYSKVATLLGYACVFGTFSTGFLALWSRMGTLFGEDDSTMVYSILSMGKGAGVILSGPISQRLLTSPSAIRLGGKDHVRWSSLIAYVGSCTSVSAIMGVLAFVAGTRW